MIQTIVTLAQLMADLYAQLQTVTAERDELQSQLRHQQESAAAPTTAKRPRQVRKQAQP